MPAKSEKQRRAAGAALRAKKDGLKKSQLKSASKDMYESMSKKQLEDLASKPKKTKK